MKQTYFASILGLIANIFLFIIRLIAGIMSNSIAVISDALDSLLDIISFIAMMISIKVSEKKPDASHPFGHYRAEPVAGLLVAIFAGILGFEVFINSIQRFMDKSVVVLSSVVVWILIVSLAVKIVMFFYFRYVSSKYRTPAIKAAAFDAKKDILVSSLVFLALIGSQYNMQFLDPLMGIVVSIYILMAGFNIGMENIDFLMGKAPDKEMMSEIKAVLGDMKIKQIKDYKNIKAHFVGTFVHVALKVVVGKKMTVKQGHDLSEKVRKALLKISWIDRVFIHVDYA